MSSNRTYFCGYCKKRITDFIESQIGKLPEKLYAKLNNATEVDEILDFLPDDFIQGDVERLDGCDLDYEFFEDWAQRPEINSDGNLVFEVSGGCDLCGTEFHYKIILPPTPGATSQKIIDLTKDDKTPKQKPAPSPSVRGEVA